MKTIFTHEPITKAMKKQKLSYRELSALTIQRDPHRDGVSSATCQRIGAGGYLPSTRSLMLICDSLGISVRRTFKRI